MAKKSSLSSDINVDLLLFNIKEKLKLSDKEIKELSSLKEIKIPITVFTSKLGMLESIVLYLRDDLGLSFKIIASIVKRDYKNVWLSYKNAKRKNE